jgi:hypothetical protein
MNQEVKHELEVLKLGRTSRGALVVKNGEGEQCMAQQEHEKLQKHLKKP